MQPGVTLVELIVTLALLGLMAGIAGVAYWNAEPVAPSDGAAAAIAAARLDAIRSRRPVVVSVRLAGHLHDATAMPDGSIIFDGSKVPDALTGRLYDAR